jgi:hypothetical protein
MKRAGRRFGFVPLIVGKHEAEGQSPARDSPSRGTVP